MSSQQQIDPKKQQGKVNSKCSPENIRRGLTQISTIELQLQYTNFKNTLQQLAQKIGDIEQEAEEHK